jgi:hypothetical protein
MVRACLYNFCGIYFLFYVTFVLIPKSHSIILQQHEASHKALLSTDSQMSFIIPPYCDMRAERPEE